MALIVEDGTARSDSNSFASVADADAFWLTRSDPAWAAASTTAKEAALVKAADYLGFAYRWRGVPSASSQALAWPRADVVDADDNDIASNVIPTAVKRAALLLAREALSVDLLTALSAAETVKKETVKLGDIEQTREYDRPASATGVRGFPHVDAVVSGLTVSEAAERSNRVVTLERR